MPSETLSLPWLWVLLVALLLYLKLVATALGQLLKAVLALPKETLHVMAWVAGVAERRLQALRARLTRQLRSEADPASTYAAAVDVVYPLMYFVLFVVCFFGDFALTAIRFAAILDQEEPQFGRVLDWATAASYMASLVAMTAVLLEVFGVGERSRSIGISNQRSRRALGVWCSAVLGLGIAAMMAFFYWAQALIFGQARHDWLALIFIVVYALVLITGTSVAFLQSGPVPAATAYLACLGALLHVQVARVVLAVAVKPVEGLERLIDPVVSLLAAPGDAAFRAVRAVSSEVARRRAGEGRGGQP